MLHWRCGHSIPGRIGGCTSKLNQKMVVLVSEYGDNDGAKQTSHVFSQRLHTIFSGPSGDMKRSRHFSGPEVDFQSSQLIPGHSSR